MFVIRTRVGWEDEFSQHECRRPAGRRFGPAPARAGGLRDGEAVTRLGMNSIRLKVTIDLNQNHALSFHDLKAMKPTIARGIAACLPESISVDLIEVTSIKETKPRSSGKAAGGSVEHLGGATQAKNLVQATAAEGN